MNDLHERLWRERQLWIALVAVLVTSTAWLALLTAALLARALLGGLPGLLVVARALLEAAFVYRREILLLGGVGLSAMLIALTRLLPRAMDAGLRDEVRHA